MNYFDLHCDTAYEMYYKKQPLYSNCLMVNLDEFDIYENKAQIFAVWSDNKKSADEQYEDFNHIIDNLYYNIDKNSDRATLCTDKKTLTSSDNRLKIIPAVEGASLLEKDLGRLEKIRGKGVRVLTLAWQGACNIGGAYDTDEGLTAFGRDVVRECERLGIIVDVSHLSERGFWDVANIASKPFIASHSNAKGLCAHDRNLTDIQLRTIIECAGIVGVNLVGKHLSKSFEQRPQEITQDIARQTYFRHISYFMEKGNLKNVAIGSDFDGTDVLPGFEGAGKMSDFSYFLKENGMKENVIKDIFYNNAYNFFAENL